MLPIDRILRQTQKVLKYNILDFCTHERVQKNIAETGHNFYLINPKAQGIKEFWNQKHGTIPKNYTLLPRCEGSIEAILNSLPSHIDFDFILAHQCFGQMQLAIPIAKNLGLPLIRIEHTLPHPSWPQSHIDNLKSLNGDFNIFITNYNKNKWGVEGQVITHGIDTKTFNIGNQKRDNHILCVVNDYQNRGDILGFQIYLDATNGLPVKRCGETKGFSEAPSSLEELVHIYQTSSIFVNTSLNSPIPCSLLEAAACGCAIVSMDNCAIGDYITHGENGFLVKDAKEMRLCLQTLLADEKLRREFGKKSRERIEKLCDMGRFCKEWNDVFERAFKC